MPTCPEGSRRLASCSERARKRVTALLACAAAVSGARRADAKIQTCVAVEADADRAQLRKLVASELERHPTHAPAEENCEARLRVELLVLSASNGGRRYLTGWLDGEVPHRVEVGSDGLALAVEELLSVLLHNDPRRLRGPAADRDWFGSGLSALRVRGHTYLGFEAFEVGARVGSGVQALPALAFHLRREVGSFHVGVRFTGAHLFGDHTELTLTSQVVAEIEAAVWASASADTSAFAALTLGYEWQRFEGPSPSTSPEAHASATASGFSPSLRAGVELFRTTSVRASGFAFVRLPVFSSDDTEGGVMHQWTPSAGLGGAVAF